MSGAANLWEDNLEKSKAEPKVRPMPEKEPAKRLKRIDRSQCFWGAIDIEKLIEEDHAARGIWAMV